MANLLKNNYNDHHKIHLLTKRHPLKKKIYQVTCLEHIHKYNTLHVTGHNIILIDISDPMVMDKVKRKVHIMYMHISGVFSHLIYTKNEQFQHAQQNLGNPNTE